MPRGENVAVALLLNPADAAATLRLLQDCMAAAKKKVHVCAGPDLTLTADDYCWDRIILNPVTARFVRDDYEGFLQREEWFRTNGLPFRRGYLFYGPPGNGKTRAIRVMAAHPAVAAFAVDLCNRRMDDEELTGVLADAVEQGPSLVILEDLDRYFDLLTPEQFCLLPPLIVEPYRTQVWIAGCLGLRPSEIMPLRWDDFDFENGTLLIQRSIVHGREGEVKTEYSRDYVPLDPALVGILLEHRERCYPTPEGWLFANPATSRP